MDVCCNPVVKKLHVSCSAAKSRSDLTSPTHCAAGDIALGDSGRNKIKKPTGITFSGSQKTRKRVILEALPRWKNVLVLDFALMWLSKRKYGLSPQFLT